MLRSRRFTSKACFACGFALLMSGCDRRAVTPEASPPTVVDSVVTEPEPAPVATPDPASLRRVAVTAMESGDLDAADEAIRAAMAIEADDPQNIFLMARVLGERNRFAEAVKMLDDMVDLNPDARLPVLGQTAEWMVLQGRWREAEQRYRTILEEVPDASVAHRKLAQLLVRQGRRLEAATHLRRACQLGEIQEFELRSLLMIVHPLAADAKTDELDPIGALGNARFEISRGNWETAGKLLSEAPDDDADAAALLGRVYAEQNDFDSLAKWAADATETGQETADYWLAMGVHEAHQDNHRAAVRCFCEAVLRDQTDSRAYFLMSQSLEKIDAVTEAKEARQRAALLQQTVEIGNAMAEQADRDYQQTTTLIDLLEQLQRPFESLAWRAVRVAYGKSRGAFSESDAKQILGEINREHEQHLKAGGPAATREFLLCGVDFDSLPAREEGAVDDANE